MTVEELIRLNMFITDIHIEVRINGSRLLDQLCIGPDFGIEPRYPTMVPLDRNHLTQKKKSAYINKSINAWDDGKEYWQLKIDRIPKAWRSLEVYSFECWTVCKHNHSRYSTNPSSSYNGIKITALPAGESLNVTDEKIGKATGDDQLEGQMNISDILGGNE